MDEKKAVVSVPKQESSVQSASPSEISQMVKDGRITHPLQAYAMSSGLPEKSSSSPAPKVEKEKGKNKKVKSAKPATSELRTKQDSILQTLGGKKMLLPELCKKANLLLPRSEESYKAVARSEFRIEEVKATGEVFVYPEPSESGLEKICKAAVERNWKHFWLKTQPAKVLAVGKKTLNKRDYEKLERVINADKEA